MSISSAISNAVSGLTAVSRGTDIVSSNIANALTEGYARRELQLSSRIYEQAGGGVVIDGVARLMNAGLLAEHRVAQADVGASTTLSKFHAAMESAFGTGTEASSLGYALTEFEVALTSAAARPDLDTRLSAVLDTAQDLASRINAISASVQSERNNAEQAIKSDVERLNTSLEQVASLNAKIVSLAAQGKDTSALQDARQSVIDSIAEIVPITEVPRDNGRVALFTTGGAVLLDGTEPSRIGFTAANNVTADMSLANGTLSGLTLNGKPLNATQQGMFSGGTLSANFAIRDEIALAYQERIDGFARELYARLSDPAVDPSLAAEDAGLFTDAQGALDPANETGFASRIAVNAAIDPTQGGQLWRIRAGLNAGTAGSAGDSTLLDHLAAALVETRTPASTSLGSSAKSLQSLSSDLSSTAASDRVRAEAAAERESTRQANLKSSLLADGVDSDKEMENLLALEKAYAANAKVLQAANEMLDVLLGLK